MSTADAIYYIVAAGVLGLLAGWMIGYKMHERTFEPMHQHYLELLRQQTLRELTKK